MRAICVTILLGVFAVVFSDDSLFCSKEFCESYLDKKKCPSLPEACISQNSTHNGLELPFPGPCNCCDYCLQNIGKGKQCAIGDPTSPMPETVCGDGLSCKSNIGGDGKDIPTCEIMDSPSTPCAQAQIKYDQKRKSGRLGHLEQRPDCEGNGLYKPYICVPGEICYCLSEDGERIFGEIPFTANPEYLLRCKCSRDYNRAKDIRNRNLHREEYLRCQSNGDYDTLQCIGDQCLCTDPQDGHPTYPERGLVNMTLISATTLPCFNNKTHMEAEYYRECEALYMEIIDFIKQYEEEGHEAVGFPLPNCQLDGYYALVQENSKTKYCSSPQSKKLGDFEVSISDPLALTMNCKCARARSIITGPEKPECCENGNYKKVQCRRGLCYCVDENGMQTGKAVEYEEKENLKCLKLGRCA